MATLARASGVERVQPQHAQETPGDNTYYFSVAGAALFDEPEDPEFVTRVRRRGANAEERVSAEEFLSSFDSGADQR